MQTFKAKNKEKCCCTCKHNIRTGDIGNVECHCEIDEHYINYVACFKRTCRRWKKNEALHCILLSKHK